MTDFRFSTQDAHKLALGLAREALEALPWRQIRDLKGFDRTRLLTSMDQRGVQIYVRANPDKLLAFNEGKPLEFWLDDERSLIDDGWQAMKASRALGLYAASLEDPSLGASTMAMGTMDDGHGGKMAIPVHVPAVEGLLEFACQVERAKTLLSN